MIIIDGEFSGLDPNKHALLSLGAVDFHNPKNQFYEECRLHEDAEYNEEALEVNGFTKEQIFDPNKQSLKELMIKFLEWLKTCKSPQILMGTTPSADRDMLISACEKYGFKYPLGHRTIDIHTLAFSKHLELNKKLPSKFGLYGLNSDTISEFVGLPAEPKPHNALNGAKWEAEIFSRLVYGKNLLEEFKHYEIPNYLP